MSLYGSPGGPQSSQRGGPVVEAISPAGWTTSVPEPPTRGKGKTRLVAIIVTLVVLVLGGGAAAYLLRRDGPPRAQLSPGVTEAPAGQVSSSADPAATEPVPSSDARFAKVGQCVKNEGTQKEPDLAITDCGPQTYQVLARVNGATTGDADAKKKCAKVAGYTNYYFSNDALDELDFVLCLKKR